MIALLIYTKFYHPANVVVYIESLNVFNIDQLPFDLLYEFNDKSNLH